MAPISTSILAKANTSALADIPLRRSVTVDFAPLAASTPREPTMKYDSVLFRPGFEALYGEKSGTPVVGCCDSGVAVWLTPPTAEVGGAELEEVVWRPRKWMLVVGKAATGQPFHGLQKQHQERARRGDIVRDAQAAIDRMHPIKPESLTTRSRHDVGIDRDSREDRRTTHQPIGSCWRYPKFYSPNLESSSTSRHPHVHAHLRDLHH